MNANVAWRTPSLVVSDGRGLPVRQVAYLRTFAADAAEVLVSRFQHDPAGRAVAQWDPRLPMASQVTVYGLSGEPLAVHSVDAGWRLTLPGVAGEALERWDERGSHWRTTFDEQLRLLTQENLTQADIETCIYADANADPALNLRGRLITLRDASSSSDFESFSLAGQSLRETRTFHDDMAFVSQRVYSPAGRLLEHTDAGGHRQRLRYDVAGQLNFSQLRINAQPDWKPVLRYAQYDAAGQITEQQTANGVVSQWLYEPENGRLRRQSSAIGTQPALQDLEYAYDAKGNCTRILDHVFSVSHFANQRVDGERLFSYDSLDRLHSASGYDDGPPSDIPGLPQPTDPHNRLNYTQTYTYDHSGNLIRLRHVRAGASHTREMSIDPASNRGVRWKAGDPLPDFASLFDRHGNLLALQPGQPLQWNTRDQLARITLIHRDNSADDQEQYGYSQGVRVYKRHERHTTSVSHFDEVRYLPGLEIRTRDNVEELHVIIVASGFGDARCLHWTGEPPTIDSDQLRYTLNDHCGSSLMELDQQARLISHEGYYPFGATAWLRARSGLEVSYKTVRYSGREMDVSGLYYYGARYYAPWLQRWISADPGGDVDGLNLYAFVGNNPMNYFDDAGLNRSPNELKRLISWNMQALSSIDQKMSTLQGQLINLQHPGKWRTTLARNVAYQVGSAATGWFTSFNAATFASEAMPGLSADLIGLTLGNNIADRSVGTYDTLVEQLTLNSPIVPRTSTFNRDAIAAELQPPSALPSREKYDVRSREGLQQLAVDGISKVVGAYVPGVGEAMALGSLAQQANEAEEGLSSLKLAKIHSTLDELDAMVTRLTASTNTAFAELGINEFYDEQNGMRSYLVDLALNRVGTAKAKMLRQSDAKQLVGFARNNIGTTREFLNTYQQKVPIIRNRYRGK
ncbi:insecticidal toxin complex protein TccC [Pseudomonas helmanticensis]|uniref:Insecticidal toxin complex protein TccC n=1 Tax=Pseudomonas helmanticensis TaxID=1471381 RepID=A0ACD2UEG9_9PSED|nr:RHS repeat-associated core domain-containing protein [Pseudomonas helmanticensis]SMQ30874.1 insecticidal toxin complex protein TccC [Pseudomonas helmanticensis]